MDSGIFLGTVHGGLWLERFAVWYVPDMIVDRAASSVATGAASDRVVCAEGSDPATPRERPFLIPRHGRLLFKG